VSAPLSVADYERLAEERLEPACFGYIAGGACDEQTVRENVEAFARLRLRPRVLAGVDIVSTATTTLGLELSLPVIVAPVAFQRLAHPDGEPAMARAARAAGTAMCLSTFATASVEEVSGAAADGALLYQIYVLRDRALTRELVERALETGVRALALTVDLPVVGKRERELRYAWAFPDELVPAVVAARERGLLEGLPLDPGLDWAYLEELCGWSPVPVVVKGILTADDALLAAEHGAAGVVVSNHGGRQLDGVAPSIEALPEIVDAVGDRLEIWLDGGIRRGTDIVKALALGARCVLAGRAPVWGLAVGGEDGARAVLQLLREELVIALALLGCRSPADVTAAHVAGPQR
jgi:4-hydroxymandelate oxidase